jgi:hypothetical protein
MKYSNFKIAILVFFCFSCSQLDLDRTIDQKIEILPEGVVLFSQIDRNDPKLERALLSLNKKLKINHSRLNFNNIINISHFQYENGLESIVFSFSDEIDRVYGQIINPINGEEKEFIIADFDYENAYNGRPSITFSSINSELKYIYSPFPANYHNSRINSWGSCMKDAIDKLYDDWEDDPIGTFGCWATGVSCLYGGAIACGIKSLF